MFLNFNCIVFSVRYFYYKLLLLKSIVIISFKMFLNFNCIIFFPFIYISYKKVVEGSRIRHYDYRY